MASTLSYQSISSDLSASYHIVFAKMIHFDTKNTQKYTKSPKRVSKNAKKLTIYLKMQQKISKIIKKYQNKSKSAIYLKFIIEMYLKINRINLQLSSV